MQKRIGRSRHRGRRRVGRRGGTVSKLRLCYGVPCAVILLVWCLFLLLNPTFSHRDDDHDSLGSHELSKHSLSVSQPEVSTLSGTSETGSLQTSEDETAVSTTLDEHGRVVTEVSAHIHVEEQAVVNKSWVETQEQPVAQEVVRPARAGHLVSLDEYKRSVIDKKQGQLDVAGNAGTIHIRHQTRDSGYNYADIAHGAKLVASNKEAKGAGHILIADKDKYLRNPCSAEDKFVVVELSEETLVDSIVIANYEFHSSNVKELELLGSLDVCPTEDWMSLGKFEAENVRHAQRFMLAEPKWVRCLMLRLITHYGFEFYCTLSVLEVHGVDAIEHLLEDWVGEDGAGSFPSSSLDTALVETSHPRHSVGGEHAIATDTGGVMARGREEDLKGVMEDAAQDGVSLHHTQGGRSSGDSVMKILMQKVKSLELNQSLFDGYLEDLNLKYKDMFNDLDQDLTSLASSLKEESAIRASLGLSLHAMVAQPSLSLFLIRSVVVVLWMLFSSDCEFCRSKLIHMENRETVVLAVALLCMLVAPLCYLIAKCIPRTQNDSWSGSCSPADQSSLGKQPKQHEKCRSSGFPYLLLSMTSAFIIWVLSV
ncbi:unnamed protein product [Sphagnum jensenii]|uniref:SUN domain-containing protein n=1 Tax=Sphagnum jensenii TaxID=128206 RepID=A0ABP1AWC5_9BRYO